MAVDARRRPAGGLEAPHLVDGIGKRDRAVDGDAVVVEQHDQFVQLQVAGERDRLLADALHQVAVGGQHVGGMIDDVVAEQRRQVALGDRHADRIGEALPKRPRGRLDAGGEVVLGMAGGQRAELAEALDLRDGHLFVAEKMQQRVEQHRAVAGREHEAVAVGPSRIGRVEFKKAGEEHGGDVGRAHRQARMTGLGLLDRVHRQGADRVRHAIVFVARRWPGGGKTRRLGGRRARRGKTVRHRHEGGPTAPGAAAVIRTRRGTDSMRES